MKLVFFSLILSCITTPLSSSMTPPDEQLFYAVLSGNLHQAQAALHRGAHVNTHFVINSTPLYWAVYHGDTNMVKLLLNAGAAVDIQDDFGETPLYIAVSKGHTEVVKLLLIYGANVNIRGHGGNPLNIAAMRHDTDMVELLINAGAYTNNLDSDGYTPLHRAIDRGYTQMVKLLLDAGASITLKNKNGQTALDLALHCQEDDIIQVIEHYLQKETQENPTRETLRKAIQANYTNIVKLLLQKGITADISDLSLAKELDHHEIGRILIKYLGATTDQYTIAKNGILNLGLPTHIAHYSMSHAL